MKNLTKIAFILAAVSMIIISLSGCAANPSGADPTAAPANRLEEILARGYIEVATEPAFAPYEFIDPSKSGDDKYVGCDMEMAKYIADALGVELRIVALEFSAVQIGVAEGKYDLAISCLAWKPDRAEAMILSKGYYFDKNSPGHGLLIRKENADSIKGAEDMAGKSIVYQSGSLQEYFVENQITGLKEVKKVSSTPDGFLMVQEGKVDACATAKGTAQLYIDNNPDCGLMLVEDFRFYQDDETDGTRIGIPLGETEFADKINEIIDEVVESGIFEQWFKEADEYARSLGV